MPQNITEKFINDIYNLAQSEYPESVVHQAKKCLLDYLGVTFAGAKMIEEKGGKLLDYLESAEGGATVIGFNRKNGMQNAALINGLSSHAAELDDGERHGMLHPGAPVISALLPLAEVEKLDGTDLLKGIIFGYETTIRLAGAMQPSLKERGYHATGICGSIGAALGAAAALGFSKQQMKDALSAAATAASGLLKVIEDGSELKPFNVGQAALSGLMAAFVARSGFKGPEDVLAGERGFLTIMPEQCNLTKLQYPNSDTFGIEKIYVKPYAACRHCHPAIEAALKIKTESGISPEAIQEVLVTTYRWAVKLHDHTRIDGVSSAKMSTPYSVAAALETGKAGINEFMGDNLNNKNIISLTQKVKVCSDEKLTELVPEKRSAIVEIRTNKNEQYIERVDLPRGEPENPVTEEELKEKFISLATYGNKTNQEAGNIIRHVWNLEKDMDKLFDLL